MHISCTGEQHVTAILVALGISVLINAVFFAFAAALRTDKVTDLSYSLSFVALAVFLLATAGRFDWVKAGAAVLVSAWGLRLGGYLFSRILLLKVDHRFDGMRDKPLAFARFWILQAVTVWVVMLPVIRLASLPSPLPLAPLTFVGALLWAVGFAIEVASDAQKFRFKSDPVRGKGFMRTGLWSLSRHPNYFGESLLWWGIFVAAAPSFRGGDFLTALGPLSLTLLLLFVSGVPLLEKSAEAKYGKDRDYQDYKRRTSLFVPLPPRK
jgi:steroid 5-alpha reductase family enzyme